MLVLSPWLNAVPLTRSWCVWEILCTIQTGARFEVALAPAERASFEAALVEDFDGIVNALIGVHVENAEAFVPDDQARIAALLEDEGAAEVNALIAGKLREWLLRTARRVATERASKLGDDDDSQSSHATLLNNIAQLLSFQASRITA